MSRPRRSAISVQLLVQFGLDHGLPIDRCLDGSALDWRLLADPAAEIDATQELRVLHNLVRHLGQRPGLGLAAGRRYQLHCYGIWGFALLSSPTYREAASLGLRYLDLTYAFHHMRLEEHGEEAHLLLQAQALPEELRAFLLERDLGGMLQVLRDLFGRLPPILRVELSLPRPADTSAYQEAFGLLPRFDQPLDRCVFPRRLLDWPLAGANPQTAAFCEQQCAQLLARRGQSGELSRQVRGLLLERPGQLPDMEQVAQRLHISSRTLRRRLDGEGSSFRQLLDEVRQALAEQLLATGGLSLEEISERLGYGEVANFIHAFKRWKGQPPRRFQRS